MEISENLKNVLQACNDADYIEFEEICMIDDDYSLYHQALLNFINGLPEQDRALLLDDNGEPNNLANDRLHAALLLRGYCNIKLINHAYSYHRTEARMLINVVALLAQDMEQLTYCSDGFDIRDIIVEAVIGLLALIDDQMDFNFALARRHVDELFLKDTSSKAVIALKKGIVEHSKDPDSLADYIGHIQYVLQDFDNADEYALLDECDADNDEDEGECESIDDEDDIVSSTPLTWLSILDRPKMSPYMSRFWDKYGERFFDENTRKKFLADLKRYRKTLEKAL